MPVVWIHASPPVDGKGLRHIRLGLEEEGIPCRVKEVPGDSAHALAAAASRESSLGVGVGVVSASREAVLHHRDLPDTRRLMALKGETFDTGPLRRVGTNAARLVKAIPLVPLVEAAWEGTPEVVCPKAAEPVLPAAPEAACPKATELVLPAAPEADCRKTAGPVLTNSPETQIDIELLTRIVVAVMKTLNLEKVES